MNSVCHLRLLSMNEDKSALSLSRSSLPLLNLYYHYNSYADISQLHTQSTWP